MDVGRNISTQFSVVSSLANTEHVTVAHAWSSSLPHTRQKGGSKQIGNVYQGRQGNAKSENSSPAAGELTKWRDFGEWETRTRRRWDKTHARWKWIVTRKGWNPKPRRFFGFLKGRVTSPNDAVILYHDIGPSCAPTKKITVNSDMFLVVGRQRSMHVAIYPWTSLLVNNSCKVL